MAKILVVDDDAGCRMTLRVALQRLGHEVAEARDGADALSAIEQVVPALVLLDVVMPEKDGIETFREIREKHPQIIVVAMSDGGRLFTDAYLRAMTTMGAVAALKKPFHLGVLVELLARVLPQARQRVRPPGGQQPCHFASTLAPLEEAVLAVFDGRIVEILSYGDAFSRIRHIAGGEVATVQTEALCLCGGEANPEDSGAPAPQADASHGAGGSPAGDKGHSPSAAH